jgi:WD40 repeat protein
LAVTGGSARLQLVTVADGAIAVQLLGHLATITDLDFSADGNRLVSVDDAGSARLWSVEAAASGTAVSVQSLGVLTRHCPWPCSGLGLVAGRFVDAAGSELWTAADDGSVIAWRRP